MSTSPNDSRATIALLLGVFGIVLAPGGFIMGPVFFLAALMSIIAIVLGVRELMLIRNDELPPDGQAFAIGGILTGGAGCLLQFLLLSLTFAFVVALSGYAAPGALVFVNLTFLPPWASPVSASYAKTGLK